MGSSNVAKVYAYWMHLGHREVRLLGFMANTSLDRDAPPVYFGGWEAAAAALGLDPENKRASAKEVFRQASAALAAAGAIVSSGHARMGNRAEYAVTLDPALTYAPTVGSSSARRPVIHWEPITREGRGNDSLPHDPNESLPHVGQRTIGSRGNESLPPMRTEEPLQEYSEDHITKPGTSTGPVDNSEQTNFAPIDQGERQRSASAYLTARPAEHPMLMARASADLGDENNVTARLFYAATLAGWRWEESA